MTLDEDTDEDDEMLRIDGLTMVIDKALLENRAPFTVDFSDGKFVVEGKN